MPWFARVCRGEAAHESGPGRGGRGSRKGLGPVPWSSSHWCDNGLRLLLGWLPPSSNLGDQMHASRNITTPCLGSLSSNQMQSSRDDIESAPQPADCPLARSRRSGSPPPLPRAASPQQITVPPSPAVEWFQRTFPSTLPPRWPPAESKLAPRLASGCRFHLFTEMLQGSLVFVHLGLPADVVVFFAGY